VALRKMTEADLRMVRKWRNEPRVRLNMFTTHEISEEEHLQWYCRAKDDPHTSLYIHENIEGSPDGIVNFTQYQPEAGTAFWGFYLGGDAEKGAGLLLGLDALELAFSLLKLHKLNAEALCTNERGIDFYRKLGFQQEGMFRDGHFNGRAYVDVVRFGMLDTEWEVSREKLQQRFEQRLNFQKEIII
jgi:UDP-4-amino-4,6-dideoxy-N-acetyl-beta-L-altrosamine N-acetyltransferase